MKKALFTVLAITLLAMPLNLIAVQTGLGVLVVLLLAGRVRGDWTFKGTPLDLPLAFFILTILASMLASAPRMASFDASASFWVFLSYYPLSQAFLIAGERERLRKVFLVVVAISTAVAAYAIVQHFTGIDVFGVGKRLMWAPATRGERFLAVGFFYRHTTLAFTLSFSLVTAAALFLEETRVALKTLLAASMAVILAAIMFTYVRMALLGVVAGLLALGLIRSRRAAAAALATVALAVAATAVVSPTVLSKMEGTFSAEGSGSRNFIWKRTLEMASDNPATGTGYGNFNSLTRTYYDRFDPSFLVRCHAHNVYLHYWTELGPIGLFAFVLLWTIFFMAAVPRAGREGLGALAAVGVTACMITGSAAQCTFFDGQIVFFFLAVMAAFNVQPTGASR
jgi:O-antigen ligase